MIHPEIAHLSIPIDSVHPHPANPNNGDTDAIGESLSINTQFRPIVVNKRTGEILAGNHTWAAAHELGWDAIAATFVDVDDDAAIRIMIADNQLARRARPDDAALADLLADLPDLAGTGYDQAELDQLLATLETVAAAPIEVVDQTRCHYCGQVMP